MERNRSGPGRPSSLFLQPGSGPAPFFRPAKAVLEERYKRRGRPNNLRERLREAGGERSGEKEDGAETRGGTEGNPRAREEIERGRVGRDRRSRVNQTERVRESQTEAPADAVEPVVSPLRQTPSAVSSF
ncbi:hypothetical protein EUGRSUZ_A01504 [Eucalyptus grandis]|uniref:Uncharacterized protein n=2 Tax=Eucalyptus grandis TaxID=71139 RepID=A0ACC3M3P7_EUCGR|nr:hypothetical protein EUGRSUZ_A01504 [Eucalyptus grandis]